MMLRIEIGKAFGWEDLYSFRATLTLNEDVLTFKRHYEGTTSIDTAYDDFCLRMKDAFSEEIIKKAMKE